MKYEISSSNYRELFEELRDYFFQATKILFDGRNSLKIIAYNQEDIVVKSFKIPHLFNKVVYTFFRDSKAKKSYDHSIKIDHFTPAPIGYVEYFKLGLLHDSYYLCKKYDYDFTIREPLLDKNFEEKEKVLHDFAFFTYELHNYNIEHLDYSPGNILIKKLDDRYEFKIIDVNRMQFKNLTDIERLENFSKLWAQDDDLSVIIDSYAKLIEMDKDKAFNIAVKASQKHKDKKNLKKRLKGKKVVD
jgi:hypothetical protein